MQPTHNVYNIDLVPMAITKQNQVIVIIYDVIS